MFPAHIFSYRPPGGRATIVALLVMLCLFAPIGPAAAAANDGATVGTAPAGGLVLGFISDIMGNRARMIQIACVVGAIGIFFLTRSFRS
jgi:hypothetical protein